MIPLRLFVQQNVFIEQSKVRYAWSALRMMGNPIIDEELNNTLACMEKVFETRAMADWDTKVTPKLKNDPSFPKSSINWRDFTKWIAMHLGHVLTDELLEELHQLVGPEQVE